MRLRVCSGCGRQPAPGLSKGEREACFSSVVIPTTGAKYLASEDRPTGTPVAVAEQVHDEMAERWGADRHLLLQVPSRAGDARFRQWYAKKTRAIAGPAAAAAYFGSVYRADARALLPAIHVPTLVLHRERYAFMPLRHGEYLTERIEGARLVVLPGGDGPLYWDRADEALAAVDGFLTGVTPGQAHDRALATVLYTDIVNSPRLLEKMGDTKWRDMLDLHDDLASRLTDISGGRIVKSTGDGVLATFDGPGRAIRFARTFGDQLRALGLAIRTGIHTGEIELRGADVGGMAVHLAARIMGEAGANEILVSRTVKDLVVGSELAFADRGTYSLRGIDGSWDLFAVP